ncbi:hypothetical protein amrb99_40970 [Actinomadura sp. RB99]|uniref:ABC transporter permease subunit n=1 Tax=Actinomadura sp. RB99 TaxID=2691577 RepID=UPI00168749A7|nr:ABC transporter permease subunit [Actinomadura sp. RB99]MBD2895163.1 hypothetical protein [Actinomadura sp. RB99]
MTAPVIPHRSAAPAGHAGFAQLLRAELTKYRTVRGWVVTIAVAILVTVLIGIMTGLNSQNGCGEGVCHPTVPTGPGGQGVTDSYYFLRQRLSGDGSITVRVSSLTGVRQSGLSVQGTPRTVPSLQTWSKAGLLVAASTKPGAPYAAVMATGGKGVRMQYDYTHDIAGRPGKVSASSPGWLRLTRSGNTLTGYDSADGATWSKIGTTRLAGLGSTVEAGLFVTSPEFTPPGNQQLLSGSGSTDPTAATAEFDRVGLAGGWSGGNWSGTFVGEKTQAYPIAHLGGHRPTAGGGYTVTGSGDIAPAVSGSGNVGVQSINSILQGVFAGMIAMVVIGALFITTEYRRGLIRLTVAASPRRGRILAAKAIVIGAVAFVAGLVAVGITVPIGESLLHGNGYSVIPMTAGTEARVLVGTAALLAVATVFAVGVGAVIRHSAGTVTVVIATVILPYVLAMTSVLPVGAARWLLRVTPAAGFAIQQAIPQYDQVRTAYTPQWGYYPLAPWAGFAVLCAWAALALVVGTVLMRRRDA